MIVINVDDDDDDDDARWSCDVASLRRGCLWTAEWLTVAFACQVTRHCMALSSSLMLATVSNSKHGGALDTLVDSFCNN